MGLIYFLKKRISGKAFCSAQVDLKDYWSDCIACPNCHTRFQVDMDPNLRIASAVICDRCPKCDTFLVMHLDWKDKGVGIIEGFANLFRMQRRVDVLMKEAGKKKNHNM